MGTKDKEEKTILSWAPNGWQASPVIECRVLSDDNSFSDQGKRFNQLSWMPKSSSLKQDQKLLLYGIVGTYKQDKDWPSADSFHIQYMSMNSIVSFNLLNNPGKRALLSFHRWAKWSTDWKEACTRPHKLCYFWHIISLIGSSFPSESQTPMIFFWINEQKSDSVTSKSTLGLWNLTLPLARGDSSAQASKRNRRRLSLSPNHDSGLSHPRVWWSKYHLPSVC